MRARALVVARLSKATGETLERSCRCASDLMWDLMCKGMRDLMCKGCSVTPIARSILTEARTSSAW